MQRTDTYDFPKYAEAFGVKNSQAATYSSWYKEIVSSGLTGDLIWQAGVQFTNGGSPDDGFAIFNTSAAYPVVTAAAAALKQRG